MASAGKTELKGNSSFKNNANSLLYGRELIKLEGTNFTNEGEVSSFGDLNMNFTGDITNLKTIEFTFRIKFFCPLSSLFLGTEKF